MFTSWCLRARHPSLESYGFEDGCLSPEARAWGHATSLERTFWIYFLFYMYILKKKGNPLKFARKASRLGRIFPLNTQQNKTRCTRSSLLPPAACPQARASGHRQPPSTLCDGALEDATRWAWVLDSWRNGLDSIFQQDTNWIEIGYCLSAAWLATCRVGVSRIRHDNSRAHVIERCFFLELCIYSRNDCLACAKKGYYIRVMYFLGRVEAEGSSGDAVQW